MGRDERVEVEGGAVLRHDVAPVAPFRVERLGRLLADEARERFVEPEVRPPGHRHEIAPPHVRELVGGDAEAALERRDRGGALVHGEVGRAVRDRAWVLHRSRLEVGQPDRVDLRVGIGDAGVVLEVAERPHVRVTCVHAAGGEPGWHPHAHRCAPRGRRRRRGLERSGEEGHEVGRDLRQAGEPRGRAAVAEVALQVRRCVRERDQAGRPRDLELPGRLELGLVEAGQRPPGVGRLELGRRVALLAACRAVQTAERFADLARPLELERVTARRKLALERQRRRLRLQVVGDRRAAGGGDRRAGDVELDAVQRELARGPRVREVDPGGAFRGPGFEIEIEAQLVVARPDVLGEPEVVHRARA